MLLPSFDSFGQAVSEENFFQKSTNQKLEWPVAAMFVNGSGRNEQSLEDLPQMLLTKFRFIWPSGFRGEDFQKSTNQKQELPVAAMFVNESERNEQSLQRTFQGCSYQVSIHLAKRFQRRNFFRNQPIRNQNGLWQPCLLTDRDEISNLQRTCHRCFLPSFGSFGQAVSEEKIFQKSTNQKQEWPVSAMFVNGSGRNQQSSQRICHRCFLPSFGSFGQAVSEKKILNKQLCQERMIRLSSTFIQYL